MKFFLIFLTGLFFISKSTYAQKILSNERVFLCTNSGKAYVLTEKNYKNPKLKTLEGYQYETEFPEVLKFFTGQYEVRVVSKRKNIYQIIDLTNSPYPRGRNGLLFRCSLKPQPELPGPGTTGSN